MDKTGPFIDIGRRIAWHRECVEQKTQERYANEAGLKRAQVSNWELGLQLPSAKGGLALLRTYGLSLDFIYTGNEETLSMSLRQAWRERPSLSKAR